MNEKASGTVLIAHSRLFREGMKLLLGDASHPIVAETDSIEGAIGIVEEGVEAELFLLDTPEDIGDPVPLFQAIRDRNRDSFIVALSDKESLGHIGKYLALGVDACLHTDMSADALKQSLELVLMGEKVLPSYVCKYLADDKRSSIRLARGRDRPERLTEREVEILQRLTKGLSNKMIAIELDITEGTVKVHLKHLLRKLGVSNRTQAALWARNQGLES